MWRVRFLYAIDDSGGGGTTEPPVPPVLPPAPPEPPAVTEVNNPAWLPDRLARAEASAVNKLLTDLGVKDAEALKSALAAAQVIEDEKKTDLQRMADELAEAKPKAERVTTLESTFSTLLENELESVPEDLRADLDLVLATATTPEGKYIAARTFLKTVAAVAERQQQSTPPGKPQAPNLNAREGTQAATSDGDGSEYADYLGMVQERGWSEEKIEKYHPKHHKR